MMTNYESSSLLLHNIAISPWLTGNLQVRRRDRHNLDIVLAFAVCFGFWLLVAVGLLLAIVA